MPWMVLIASALFEAVWATALGRADGFTQPVPTIVFAVALTLSMLGLGWAAKHISIGTAYAVWVGIGAALTVTYAILTGEEPFSLWKGVFLAGIIGAVVGLKLVPAQAPEERTVPDDQVGHRADGLGSRQAAEEGSGVIP